MLISRRVLVVCPDSPGFERRELVPVSQSEERISGVETES